MPQRIGREELRRASLQYRVVGVHCVSCKRIIEEEVRKIPGVRSVQVDPVTRVMRVEASGVDFNVLRRTVMRLGYDLEVGEAVFRIKRWDPALVGVVRKVLSGFDGIYDVRVSHDGVVRVVYDPGLTREDAIREGLESAGLDLSVESGARPPSSLLYVVPGFLMFIIGNLLGIRWVWLVGVALSLAGAVVEFIVPAVRALSRGHVITDTLLALGVLSSFVASVYGHISGGHVFWDAVVFITFFVVLGRSIEYRLRERALESVSGATQVLPGEARVYRDGRIHTVSADSVRPGEVVVVSVGERVPVDGRVRSGRASVDERIITGESKPREVSLGDIVYAGTMVVSGGIEVTALRTGEWRLVARLARSAGSFRSRLGEIADRIVAFFVPTVLLIAGATFIVHILVGSGWETAMLAGITVLVVACPCALGIAIPAASAAFAIGLARMGVVAVDPGVLDVLPRCRHVVFDKTGTLTWGSPRVVNARLFADERWVVRLVYILESASAHPVARALRDWAGARGGGEGRPEWFEEFPGKGIVGGVMGHTVVVGSRRLAAETLDGDALPEDFNVFVVVDGRLAAAFKVEDDLKPLALETVRSLISMGLKVHIASGDSPGTVERIARRLGIPPGNVRAGVDPFEKAEYIEGLRRTGPVIYVGDGVNDVPAMTSSDVGIAVGQAVDMAKSSSSLYLERSDIHVLPSVIKYSRRARRVMSLNLFWAFAYNSVLIPVAAGALAWAGITLTPGLAALAMSLSSMMVTLTSLTLLYTARSTYEHG